jgi:hypothetical protein
VDFFGLLCSVMDTPILDLGSKNIILKQLEMLITMISKQLHLKQYQSFGIELGLAFQILTIKEVETINLTNPKVGKKDTGFRSHI